MKITITESWEWNVNLNDVIFLGINKKNNHVLGISNHQTKGFITRENYLKIYKLLIKKQMEILPPELPSLIPQFNKMNDKLIKSKIKIVEITPKKTKYAQLKINELYAIMMIPTISTPNTNTEEIQNVSYIVTINNGNFFYTTFKDYVRLHNIFIQIIQYNKMNTTNNPKITNPLYGIEL